MLFISFMILESFKVADGGGGRIGQTSCKISRGSISPHLCQDFPVAGMVWDLGWEQVWSK